MPHLKALIFGAGAAGAAAYHHVSRTHEIIGFVDNDPNKTGTLLHERPILSPSSITELVFDRIFIASEYFEQIARQLQETLGLPPETITVLPASALSDFSIGNGSNRQLAEQVLFTVTDILQQQDIPYYVDAGTLLGIVRDNALIPWDTDLDLALPASHSESCYQALTTALPALARLTDCSWQIAWHTATTAFGPIRPGDLRCLKLTPHASQATLPNLDVFIKYIEGKTMYYVLASRGFIMPAAHIEYLESTLFNGRRLNVPGQPRTYLERHYGKDWHIPSKDWNLGMLNNTVVFTKNS